ncbi:hypothetical protein CC78DRAFT_512061 [Lojkania enalia]|uniref:SNF2 N-terminal domain-containing protein n=1 Tax=Lojkania enalia TaxID=147567 RepID=A0A9P4KDW2_9PLEO|nr:hypothetical protein CC78DRAFT_512061 [Didymosphaeria enalia]
MQDDLSDEDVDVINLGSRSKPVKKKTSNSSSSRPKAGKGIDLNLPPLSNIEDIFLDLTTRALDLGLSDAVDDLKNRNINVATMCSGTESPLIAIQMISKSLEKIGKPMILVNHHFSAEIDLVKQGFIERNFQPRALFRDVREFIPENAKTATTAYGAEVPIPEKLDILIAGFVCKDLSRLNNRPKGLEDEGESGDTWLAVHSYVKKFRPSIVLIENVQNTHKFWNAFESRWEGIGYASTWLVCDTKNYYLPQTRKRMYMVAIEKSLYGLGVNDAVDNWKNMVRQLKRQCSCPFDAFLSEDVQDLSPYGARISEVNWDLCKLRYDRIRSDERLGLKCPVTRWNENGTPRPPDFANRKWYQSQSSRVHDAIDIAYLQGAQAGYDALYKMAVWDVSQNVDRFKTAPGILPCITPNGCDFVSNRQTALGGSDLLVLQGMPKSKLLFAKETQKEQQDLAGNAMTTTVIGTAIISALIYGRSSFRDLAYEASPSPLQSDPKTKLGVPARVKDIVVPSANFQELDLQQFIKDASYSSRLCNCEGSRYVAKSPIRICQTCKHSACLACLGNPTHEYNDTISVDLRKRPNHFEETWRPRLPAQIRLYNFPDGKNSNAFSHSVAKRIREVNINSRDFSITNFQRSNNMWQISYVSADATLKLLVGECIQWQLYIKCPSLELGNSGLRETLKQPLARGLVQNSLLEPEWEIFIPHPISCKLPISGSTERVSSWRNRIGLPDFRNETVPRYLNLDIHTAEDYIVRKELSGQYALQPNCGTAMSSLYKSCKGKDIYLFLESDPISRGELDRFVFSLDCRRIPFGEARAVLAELDCSWRPWNVQVDKISNVSGTIPGRWVKTNITIAHSTVPIRANMPASLSAMTFSDCRLPWQFLDVKIDRPVDISTFSGYSWALQQVKILPFSAWTPCTSVCPQVSCICAPATPRILWNVNKNGTATAYEDRQSAAIFERMVKTRPPIFDIRASSNSKGARVQVGVNIVSLMHRARSRLSDSKECRMSWRLITNHITPSWDPFGRFRLQGSLEDPYEGPLTLRHQLSPEQKRSLMWMHKQEFGSSFTISEVEEEIHNSLGWRAEAKVETEITVRGGVLADLPSFGKTVTIIGLIKSEFELMEPHDIVESNQKRGNTRLVDIAATLVVCPPHIARQWREELERFLGLDLFEEYNVLLIERFEQLQKLTIADFQAARIVIASWKIFSQDAYVSQLAHFTAMPEPAELKGRAFDAWLNYAIQTVPLRVEELKIVGVSAFEANTKSQLESRLEKEEFKAVVPLKIRHGNAYQSYSKLRLQKDSKTVSKKKSTQQAKAMTVGSALNWISLPCPSLQLFRFNRLVVDEYHYLYENDAKNYSAYAAVRKISAVKKWLLSGVPALSNFSDVSRIASLLGVTLGRETFSDGLRSAQLERKFAADKTDFEKFLFRTKINSYYWHHQRHRRAQAFLDQFVRQNEPALKHIACTEFLRPINISMAHHAVYLELSQHLISQRMQIKKLNDRSRSDRVGRLNASLNNSITAEDALLKLALMFETLEGRSGIDVLMQKREQQLRDTKVEILSILADAETHQKRSKTAETHYASFKQDVKFLSVVGDKDAGSILADLVRDLEMEQIPRKKATDSNAAEMLKAQTSTLRSLARELLLRIRSYRFIESVKELSQEFSGVQVSRARKCSLPDCAGNIPSLSQLYLISHCGHIACQACLRERKDGEGCIHADCDVSVQPSNLIKVSELDLGRKEPEYNSYGNKLHAICKLIEQLPNDDQAIVFVPNEDTISIVKAVFDDTNISYHAVSKARPYAAENIEDFKYNTDPDHKKKVLILNLLDESASGVNLVNANHIVFVSPLLADSQHKYDSSMAQAIARSRRYRQRKTVHIYHFAALHTIDIDILEHRHKRSDALYDSTADNPLDYELSPKGKPPKEKTKCVRNKAGKMALIPMFWLTDQAVCNKLDLDPENLGNFTSSINFSETFDADDDT